MIAMPAMLVNPALDAGINVPEDLEDYDPERFPHWYVFNMVQLGAPMPDANSHFANAKVIASVTDEDITKVTHHDLENMGVV